MNEKFFSLPPEKQQRILNAGFRVVRTFGVMLKEL